MGRLLFFSNVISIFSVRARTWRRRNIFWRMSTKIWNAFGKNRQTITFIFIFMKDTLLYQILVFVIIPWLEHKIIHLYDKQIFLYVFSLQYLMSIPTLDDSISNKNDKYTFIKHLCIDSLTSKSFQRVEKKCRYKLLKLIDVMKRKADLSTANRNLLPRKTLNIFKLAF